MLKYAIKHAHLLRRAIDKAYLFSGSSHHKYAYEMLHFQKLLTIPAACIFDLKFCYIYLAGRALQTTNGLCRMPWIEGEVPYSKYFLADAGYVNKGTTFPGFFRQMDIAFLDTSLRDKALSKLNPLRQHNRSFSELVSEFDRLLTVKDPVGRRITPNRSGKSTTD